MLDPEIVEGFKEETTQLMQELTQVVEKLEDQSDEFPSALLEEFAQKIDRIMGTAKTLSQMDPGHEGLVILAKFGELCKATGYKAAASKCVPLVPIFAAFWADTVDTIEDIVKNFEDEEKIKKITQEFSPVIHKRLEWLAKQVMTLTKDSGNEQQSQIQVDALLQSLGL